MFTHAIFGKLGAWGREEMRRGRERRVERRDRVKKKKNLEELVNYRYEANCNTQKVHLT